MIEIFKTNVCDPDQAAMLLNKIDHCYGGYIANFDLEDCDKILRVSCDDGSVESKGIIDMMREAGYRAEVLQDEPLDPKMNSGFIVFSFH